MHRQIKADLGRKITSGELAPGAQLPTEGQLQELYGVSRITAQHALRRLVEQGLVIRRPGRGTFVSQATSERNLLNFINFLSEELPLEGTHQVLEAKVIGLTGNDAATLAVGSGEAVISLRRLKLGPDGPAALETSFLPFRLAPALLEQRLEDLNIYAYLRRSGIKVSEAKMYLDPHVLGPDEASLLALTADSLAFVWERISLADGRPVELSRFVIPTDKSRFFVDFSI